METQFILTVLNGITSSTSLLVGFAATLATFSVTIKTMKKPQHKKRISETIGSLTIPVLLLFMAYTLGIMSEDYDGALRFAMSGLVASFFLLLNLVDFITSLLGEDSS